MERTRSALKITYVLVPGPIPDLLKQYGLYNEQGRRAMPATLIVDKAGIVRWRYVGHEESARPGAATIIKPLGELQ